MGAGEMAPHLGAFAALPDDLVWTQQPHGDFQTSGPLLPLDTMPSSDLHGSWTYMQTKCVLNFSWVNF